MATVVSNSEYDTGAIITHGTSCGKVQCCHGNHINYRMLLKLINADRQQPHLAKGYIAVIQKEARSCWFKRQSWFVGYF